MAKSDVIHPPLKTAWQQALAGIRVRLGRQFLTFLSICLASSLPVLLQIFTYDASNPEAEMTDQHKWLFYVSMLMCVVGITNTMLMSVAERFREIGTLKCLGAPDSFIVKVFLIEAILLGSVGSISGGILSVLLSFPFLGAISPILMGKFILMSLSYGLGITLLSAVFPAIQASKMPAVAALRVEI